MEVAADKLHLGMTGLGEGGYRGHQNGSIVVTLEGLELSGTPCLEALELSFQVACLRCIQAAEVTFSAADVSDATSHKCPTLTASNTCTKCSQDIRMTMVPHLVHEHSNTLAHLKVVGCSPVDILPCCFGAQCDSCSALASMRRVQVRSSPPEIM